MFVQVEGRVVGAAYWLLSAPLASRDRNEVVTDMCTVFASVSAGQRNEAIRN